MISTRGRYALRVMIDLAEHIGSSYIPLKDIAERQQISEKYLESIVKILVRNGLLDALRGKGGGYRLNRSPAEYTVGSILRLTARKRPPASARPTVAPYPCGRNWTAWSMTFSTATRSPISPRRTSRAMILSSEHFSSHLRAARRRGVFFSSQHTVSRKMYAEKSHVYQGLEALFTNSFCPPCILLQRI